MIHVFCVFACFPYAFPSKHRPKTCTLGWWETLNCSSVWAVFQPSPFSPLNMTLHHWTGSARQQWPCDAFTHKQTLLFYSSRSVNLGSTLAFHMTEVECEISAQTFMRADLRYITSVPHRGAWNGSEESAAGYCSSAAAGSRTAKEIEKMVSRGSRGWGRRRVFPRLLSLPASQTWLHCGSPARRCDLTRADGDHATQH